MPRKPNETYLDYKKRVIDTKSKSWCAAKAYNATIWLGSGMSTSCHHPPAHKVDEQVIQFNPKALHNTPEKKADRALMKKGERPVGCEYCWKIEDMAVIGGNSVAISDRVYKTVIYTDEDLQTAYDMNPEDDVDLKTLEIAFDRTCQFACSYCNPAFSTTWVKDIRNNGPYNDLISDGRNHFTHKHDSSQLYSGDDVNPYVEAFFKWWESDLHKTLQELRITGGEPLMSGHTWRLIDWFKENRGRSNTRLAINSNLGKEIDVDRLLESVAGLDVDIYTSNESFGHQAEYIRDGLDWNAWMSNMYTLLHSRHVRAVHVMNTINALCLDSLPQFLSLLVLLKRQFGTDKVNFTLNILRFPSFQSPLVLPDKIKTVYMNDLKACLKQNEEYLQRHEKDHLLRLIDYLDIVKTPHSDAFDMPKLHNDFKKFYEQYDQRRGKNFRETFPDLTEWYDRLSV